MARFMLDAHWSAEQASLAQRTILISLSLYLSIYIYIYVYTYIHASIHN